MMPNGIQTQTQPRYGLPYQQLPGTGDITPESMLQQEIQTGRRAIQDRFKLQWDEIGRSAQFIGRQKASGMRQQLHARAKQEMLQFNQRAQQQLAQLQNIDRLAQQGAITNPDEIKARITFGTDVAKSMYPTPAKERTIPQQFGELDVYSHRISQELENFRIIPGKKPSRLFKGLGFVSPLIGAVSAYRSLKRKGIEPELEIWDPIIPAKDPKTDEDVMGDWRKVEPEEVGIYEAWLQEEKDIAARKRELLGQPDISRRRVQPDTKGGTFGDKIAESIRPQRQRSITKPKVIRQRSKLTGQIRESYDGGKSWQIVSG